MLREGMPGWLKAVEAVIRASAPAARTSEAVRSPLPQQGAGYAWAPAAWPSAMPRHDLTTLLASLVLSTRRLERSSPREAYQSCH